MSDETAFQMCLRAIQHLVKEKTGLNINDELRLVSQVEKTLQNLRISFEEEYGTERAEKTISDVYLILKRYVSRLAETKQLESQKKKLEEPSGKFPEEIQPVIDRLDLFIKRSSRAKQKVDDLLDIINEMMKPEPPKDYSKVDLTAIRLKKLDLDAALETWENLIKQAEKVLSEFDQDIKTYRENHKTKWTCALALLGLTGGIAAIGFGVGGILGAGLVLHASTAGASIGGGATVSGISASVFGMTKIKQNKHDEVVKKLCKEYEEFKTEHTEIKREYEEVASVCGKLPEKMKEIELETSGQY